MKIKRKSKYLLVGGAIIGALAIIAGSTAAVTIHSNNKLVAKSATTNSSKPNSSNPSKSASTTKNSSTNSPSPSTPDTGKTNSGSAANQNNPSSSSKNNNPNNSDNGADQNGANKQNKNAKDAQRNTQGNGGQSKKSNSNPDKIPLNKDGSGSTGSSNSGSSNGNNGNGPGPVSPTDSNSLNYDLDINQNQASLSNVNAVNYLTNSFSLTNIKENGKSINVNNSSGTLTYTIIDLINNKILTTKTLVLSTSSPANWTNFSYNFAPVIDNSSQLFSISVSLSISNATSKKPLIENTTYNFKIINPLQLSTSYSENGSLEQLFEKQMLDWVGNSSSTEWYDFINQWYYWYRLDNVTAAYFDDVKVYFSQMPANDNYGSNEFLTIQATSTKPISMWWITTTLQNITVVGSPLSSSYGAAATWITPIAAGHIFTWTLPFELAQLTYSNGNLQLPLLPTSFWVNDYQPASQIWTQGKPEPFGLSIGTLSNPTAVSNDAQFNNLPNNYENEAVFPTQNGVLGMAYDCPTSWGIGNNYTWYDPSEFSFSCPLNASETFSNSLNISSSELINFKNTATYSGQTVSSPTFSGTYTYSIINKTAGIDYSNNGSLSGNNLTFNYYFDKFGEYEITITYILNNVLDNKTITNTQTYYVNYQTSTSTSSSD